MAPFRFRLEQVRQYRRQLEEQAMQALAQAVQRRDALVRRMEMLETEIAAQQERLGRSASLEAAERWLTLSYLDGLRADHNTARSDLQNAEDVVDQCRTALVERARERNLLDRLKEKQASRHQQLESQQEQRTNDETATLRYRPATL